MTRQQTIRATSRPRWSWVATLLAAATLGIGLALLGGPRAGNAAAVSPLTVDGGRAHSCALLASGGVVCWGDNQYGQLGNGTTGGLSGSPVNVIGVSNAVSLSVGDYFACAALADGSVKCWGSNDNSMLGDGTYVNRPTPVTVVGVANAVKVSAATTHACAVLSDATLKCWGANFYGGFGNGTTATLNPPFAAAAFNGVSNIVAVSAGWHTTCVLLADQTVKCAGRNFNGQLGDGTNVDRSSPVAVVGLSGATAVAAGFSHACALLAAGTVVCWGSNYNGELGNGATAPSIPTPVPVVGVSGAVSISVGVADSCALLSSGTVKCWGWNFFSKLGNGTTVDSAVPVQVTGVGTGVALGSGQHHNCVWLANGTVHCWGWNGSLQAPSTTVVLSSPNAAPTVAAGSTSVSTTAGTNAVNTGTYNDADANNTVTLTASAGTVTKTGTNSGTWSWSNSAPAAATYSVTVTASDGTASAQTSFSVTVADLTTTTLASSPNPSTGGQSVTFTATVSPATATGTVTFKEGAITVGTGTLVSGVATYATTTLAVGSHAVAASYSGAAGYAASTSGALTQTVIIADATPPVIVPTVTGTLGNNGWYTSDVNVSWTVTDAQSSITTQAGCDPTTVNADTASVTFTCTATSTGGTDSQSVTVKRDATAPVATATVSPAPNGAGWNNTDVTVTFAGTDGMSGVASCAAPVLVSTEGAGQPASGTCTDNAGNVSASATASVNIDKTAPTATTTAAPTPNGNGWNNTDMTVTFTGADGLSGIASCSPAVVLGEGGGQSATGTCSDKAGNVSAPATASNINVDKTAPSVTVTGVTNGASYIVGGVPMAGCATTDTLSGVATSATVTTAGGPLGSVTVTCAGATDKAGNAAAAVSATYRVSYDFCGFKQPILVPVQEFKTGSTIPVKFCAKDANGVAVATATGTVEAYVNGVLQGTEAIRFSDGQYIANVQTKTGKVDWPTGTLEFRVKLNDGSTHSTNTLSTDGVKGGLKLK